MDLLSPFKNLITRDYETSWRAPSNIAFVKYWGKKGHQLPANSSLSMTLKDCVTTTQVSFRSSNQFAVELYLDGVLNLKFSDKVSHYLQSLFPYLPFLKKTSVKINTANSFPHGTGIASSASGMAAFALCLTDYLYYLADKVQEENFFKTASFLSRLASGSACRSVFGSYSIWGECSIPATSDEFATPFVPHKSFNGFQDSILVISSEEKKISSRQGHGLMQEHFFAESRFRQAKKNFVILLESMQTGDFNSFGKILELEALSLHAMMMTSPSPYMLMRPNTLMAIELVTDFRNQTGLPIYFTLDAGPNLHLIYPESIKEKVHTFIHHELEMLSEKVIHDQLGEGPSRC